jgi:hypothetical protein
MMNALKRMVASCKSWMRLPENIFLVIFLAFGLAFITLVPPGWNTDELDHTYRMDQLSRGVVFSEKLRI